MPWPSSEQIRETLRQSFRISRTRSPASSKEIALPSSFTEDGDAGSCTVMEHPPQQSDGLSTIQNFGPKKVESHGSENRRHVSAVGRPTANTMHRGEGQRIEKSNRSGNERTAEK